MLKVKVRYYGRLRELLDVSKEEYEVGEGATLADLLLKYIPEKHTSSSGNWRETIFRTMRGELLLNRDGSPVLQNHLVLVDSKTTSLVSKLKDGDEIAILPPFGGG